jgi:FlaA1/EpsC-like NDP-sugar epimerase
VNIARRYAFLVGANDLTITCSGQRPGEKIAEELIAPEEMCHPTDHPAITSIPVHPGDLIYRAAIQGLVDAAKGGANPELLYRTLAEVSGASSAVEKEKCSAHS